MATSYYIVAPYTHTHIKYLWLHKLYVHDCTTNKIAHSAPLIQNTCCCCCCCCSLEEAVASLSHEAVRSISWRYTTIPVKQPLTNQPCGEELKAPTSFPGSLLPPEPVFGEEGAWKLRLGMVAHESVTKLVHQHIDHLPAHSLHHWMELKCRP